MDFKKPQTPHFSKNTEIILLWFKVLQWILFYMTSYLSVNVDFNLQNFKFQMLPSLLLNITNMMTKQTEVFLLHKKF